MLLSKIYDKVRKYVYPIILIIGLLFCVSWSISPLREKLIKLGWIEDKSVFGVVGILITITIFELQQHEKTSRRLSDHIASFNPAQSSTLEPKGVQEVYSKWFNPAVRKMISESKRETTIDILGLTLFSVWPFSLKPSIKNEEIRRCTINLYLIKPEFIERNLELFSAQWLAQVKSSASEIEGFKVTEKELLDRNHLTVNVKPYDFFPGVHGFRTSDGELMISFIQWSRQQKTVDDPHQFYEVFTASDLSPRANAYRNLFENWLARATRG